MDNDSISGLQNLIDADLMVLRKFSWMLIYMLSQLKMCGIGHCVLHTVPVAKGNEQAIFAVYFDSLRSLFSACMCDSVLKFQALVIASAITLPILKSYQ